MSERTVVLDNEAVQALLSVTRAKHRAVLAHVQVVATRKAKARPLQLVVPTTVRVEAGWDRTRPTAAFANRLRIVDIDLDTRRADGAASLRAAHGVSVADAHLGVVMADAAASGAVTILTSDPDDARTTAGDIDVTIVVI